MNVNETVIKNIKILRLKNNLKQVDVAEALFTDISVYSRIETGQTRISSEKLFYLAKLYGVSIDSFYEDVELGIRPDLNIDSNDLTSLSEIKTLLREIKALAIKTSKSR